MLIADIDDTRLKKVWNQATIPVVLRRKGKGQRLRARIPFAEDNKQWLQEMGRIHPIWIADGRYWELPKAWFNDFVNRALHEYKNVYVIQPYREQEKCSPSCLDAEGHECECSCMGVNHGAGNDGSWFEVSDAFAVRYSEPQLACRLMTLKSTR